VRVGDKLGEILLQHGHDPFHLVARPARKRRRKGDAVGQNDERHRAQWCVRSRLTHLARGGVVRQRGGTAARSRKVEPIIAHVHSDVEIETAIIALGREPGGGLVVMADAFTTVHRAPIILVAARNNVPAVYYFSHFVRDGGLLSYGPDEADGWRRAATYADRILRGAKPGDLPVQFPTKYEMVVNLKTAKALGLTIPPNLLALADEVIE
jgi:putative tryptophan/tyrosine transport system substrate-binding protein